MTRVPMSAEDEALLNDAIQNFVLKRYLERCGSDCMKQWNETIGDVAGVKAPL